MRKKVCRGDLTKNVNFYFTGLKLENPVRRHLSSELLFLGSLAQIGLSLWQKESADCGSKKLHTGAKGTKWKRK